MYNSIREFNESFSLRSYVISLYNVKANSGNHIKIPCPFHSESTASCVIYDNAFHCFGAGCGAHGSPYDFVHRLTGLSRNDILTKQEYLDHKCDVRSVRKVEKEKYPSQTQVDIYNKDLLRKKDKLDYLLNRNFDLASIEKSKIGYVSNAGFIFSGFKHERYSIPVYNENSELVTARYRIDPQREKDDSLPDEPKYLSHPGTRGYLYNSSILSHYNDIVVVGSELDAAFLYHRYQVHAIAPPGEGAFQLDWLHLFRREHNVLIWLDYDYAGIASALRTYDMLKTVCNPKVYAWGNTYSNKDDVCDFVNREGIMGIYEVLSNYGIKAYS